MKMILSSPVFLKPFILIEQKVQLIDDLSDRLRTSVNHILEIKLRDFKILAEKANMLSPLNVLSRGYSIAWRLPENMIVKNAEELSVNDLMRTKVHRGELISRVTEVKADEKEK
jgi:exodeoxyribonuclease VII large subunit